MTLESIEKLRSYAMVIEWATDDARNMWTEAVDSVEHEIERDYMKPPEDAWAERIGMLEAENAELREKLGEAIGHAHEIGKLGDLELKVRVV